MNRAAAIEQASRRAYPALEECVAGELVLRAANGYTKRANSGQLLRSPVVDRNQVVTDCEAFYFHRRQAAIVRLLSFMPDPGLDALLDDRGYSVVEPSRVMVRDLSAGVEAGREIDWWHDRRAWSELHARLSEHAPEAAYARMLARVEAQPLMAVVEAQGAPVACGMGVVDGSLVGLFNLVVAADRRGRGIGARLIGALLAAGHEHGAAQAYLQVVAANPAVRLYERFGFVDAYRYHYRVKPLAAA